MKKGSKRLIKLNRRSRRSNLSTKRRKLLKQSKRNNNKRKHNTRKRGGAGVPGVPDEFQVPLFKKTLPMNSLTFSVQ